jgi:hypothetical protein
MRGLCPLRGVLVGPDGRRWRVAHSGDARLDEHPAPVAAQVAALPAPPAAPCDKRCPIPTSDSPNSLSAVAGRALSTSSRRHRLCIPLAAATVLRCGSEESSWD